jgi:GTP-binding protein
VDLPGYGYARRSKELRIKWEEELEKYLRGRANLQCVFVLVDSRIEPQESDLDFINFLGKLEVPFAIIFTKTDKLNQRERAGNATRFTKRVLEYWEELPPVFQTSSVAKKGRSELLQFIGSINKKFARPVI